VRRQFSILPAIVALTIIAFPVRAAGDARVTQSLDAGWKFSRGNPEGAEKAGFADTAWRTLDVPHDWSIEGPFDLANPTRGSGGFLPAGVGWYRKHFTLPKEFAGRRVFVEFDGVMANSDVWINGAHLGTRPYGYVSFGYELTSHLEFGEGKTNVLAVRAENSGQPASRWYSGAGIYRHARLVATSQVHVEKWGLFVTTPMISADGAAVSIHTTVTNQSDKAQEVVVHAEVYSPNDRKSGTSDSVSQKIPAGGVAVFQQEIRASKPQFWDLEHPNLYRAVARVRVGKTEVDSAETKFGIREARFEADTGFWLNGKNFKIKGVCLHHDGGGVGAAVPLGVWEYRLEELRKLGCNAIRTAHNPPAPEFLDLCDRMGFLVMDEMFDCWTVAKNPFDYHLYFNEWSKTDTADTIRRDRNHPSVVVYSVGNEIHDTPKPEIAKPILAGLVEVCHANDPSRPVSQGLFRPNVSHDYDNGLADLLDVVGQNYRENEILAAHAQKPARKILGTENSHDRSAWIALRDNAPYAGQFLWSGIDYLGESRQWPTIGAASGLLDRTGFAKTRGHERASWWSTQPVVCAVRRVEASRATPADPGFNPLAQREPALPDWSPRNSEPHQETVDVYSNCESVELFLNGKSLGANTKPANDSARTWTVSFEPGVLKTVGKNQGKVVASQELRTAGPPAKIVLTASRSKITPDWDDVSCVSAMVTDKDGTMIPGASDLISFKLTGPGLVAAVDNGDNLSHESFQASERHAFRGRCIAIIKATGAVRSITLTASATGLKSGSISIQTARK
jgi:beta-galactosidase